MTDRRSSRPAVRLGAVLAAAALTAAACSGSSSKAGASGGGGTPAASGNSAAAAPVTSKGGTLRFVIASTPSNFDPATSQDNQSIAVWDSWWEYLVKPNADRTSYQPMLASSWTVSPDQKTYTFTLRPGVTFSDGTPMTSADVVYSLTRTIDNSVSLLNFLQAKIARISAPTAGTVVIAMKAPDPNLLADLSGANAAVYPEAAVKRQGEKAFFRQPIGTGPFVLSAVTPGTSYTVTRNPHYWDAAHAAKLDKIELTVVADDTARATAVQGGRADVAEGPPTNQLTALSRISGLRTASYPSAQVELIALNTAKAPLNNLKLRQAISLAVDRPAVVKSALFGAGTPATTFLVAPAAQTHQNPALNLYPFDLARAKALVTESGLKTPVTVDLGLSTGSTQDAILTILQNDLAKVGVNLRPIRKDAASTDNDITGGTFTMNTTFWGNLTADPSTQPLFAVDPAYCCKAYFTNLDDKAAVALVRQATSTTDASKVQGLYDKVQQAVATDAAIIPIYYPTLNYVLSNKVGGFRAEPYLTYPWTEIGFR